MENAPMLIEILLLTAVPTGLLVMAISRLIGLRFYTVPEVQRFVIQRHGRLQRVVGPGVVWVCHGFERIERKLTVREHPEVYFVRQLTVGSVTFGYRISFWCRFDPHTVMQDAEHLKQMVQLEGHERHQQIEQTLHDLFVKHLSQMIPLGKGPRDPVNTLRFLAPGQPACEQVLDAVARELPNRLRPLGMIVNTAQPITITGMDIAQTTDMLLAFDQTLRLARHRLPDLPDDELAQFAGAAQHLHPYDIHKLKLAPTSDHDQEASPVGDDTIKHRFSVKE